MRYEFKYYASSDQLEALRNMLQPFTLPDEYAAEQAGGHYTVRSIYFDTPNFQMYHRKQDHFAHRMKVRLRGYNIGNDESKVFLELKRKYEGPILKNRCGLPYGVVKKIFQGAAVDDLLPEIGKPDNLRRFFYQIYQHRLKPVVTVAYEREVFLSKLWDPENNLRITIDKNLRAIPYPGVDELYEERNVQHPLPHQFILEVKFNQYCPVWMKPILAHFSLQKAPASKYVLCIDAQPEIKTDHWGGPLLRGKPLFFGKK